MYADARLNYGGRAVAAAQARRSFRRLERLPVASAVADRGQVVVGDHRRVTMPISELTATSTRGTPERKSKRAEPPATVVAQQEAKRFKSVTLTPRRMDMSDVEQPWTGNMIGGKPRIIVKMTKGHLRGYGWFEATEPKIQATEPEIQATEPEIQAAEDSGKDDQPENEEDPSLPSHFLAQGKWPAVGSEAEALLRNFDLTQAFGPCIGPTRLERWRRAEKWGLTPPAAVLKILETLDADDARQHSIWQMV